MVAAMAGFAVEDMFLKAAAQSVPVAQVMVIFGAGGALCFAALAILRGEPFLPRAGTATLWVRAAFELTGRLFYTLAIALTPLSSASAILQATPIVVVAGAAIVFGEKVGWRRWSAILIGLAGVLVILRPGAEAFSPLSILAVLGMLGFAGRDLATRAAAPSVGWAVLGVYGFLAIVVAGVLLWRLERDHTDHAKSHSRFPTRRGGPFWSRGLHRTDHGHADGRSVCCHPVPVLTPSFRCRTGGSGLRGNAGCRSAVGKRHHRGIRAVYSRPRSPSRLTPTVLKAPGKLHHGHVLNIEFARKRIRVPVDHLPDDGPPGEACHRSTCPGSGADRKFPF